MQNYKTQKKKNFWGRLINKSIIASLLTYLSVRFHYILSDSFVARIFNISPKTDTLKENSTFGTLYSKLDRSPVFPTLRRTFAKSVESSFFVGLYRTFVRKVVTASVRSTGVFFLSGGLYSLLGYIMKWVQNGADFRTYYEIVMIAAMIFTGIFLVFSQPSNGRKLHESRFFSTVLFDLLGLNKLSVDKDTKSENHFLVAFFGGLVFGIAAYITTVKAALIFVVTIIMLLITLYSPESGILLAMILMPVSKQSVMEPIMFVLLISDVLKLLRGKRNLSFKSEDTAALLFAVLLLLFFPVGNKAKLALMLTVYFMASNLMRNTEYLKKSVNALSLGLSINVIVNSVIRILSLFGTIPSPLSSFSSFAFAENTECISAAALVFALYMLLEKNSIFHIVYRLLFLVASLAAVFLSASEKVWIFALAAVFIYSVYRTLKFFNVTFVYLLVLPIVFFAYNFSSYILDIKKFSFSEFDFIGKDLTDFLFGSDLLGENMEFTMFSAFGIFGCLLTALLLYLLFSRLVSVSKRSGKVPREFCALMTGSIFVFASFGTHASFDAKLLIFWTLCGLVSAAGNIKSPVDTDDVYY